MNWFWPIRTGITFFDVWTIIHLCFWVFMGSNFWNMQPLLSLKGALILGLLLSYAWEVFERYAEVQHPVVWKNPETWLNSYVSDPLTSIIGILIAWYMLDNWRL